MIILGDNALFRASAPAGAPGGWWDVPGHAAYCAYDAGAASSFENSLIDLSGNGNDAWEPGSSPDWAPVIGWDSATTEYLGAPYRFVNSINYHPVSIFCQYSDSTQSDNRCLFGAGVNTNRGVLIQQHMLTGDTMRFANTNLLSFASAGSASATVCIAGAYLYRNGALLGGPSAASWTFANNPWCFIGGYCVDGSLGFGGGSIVKIQKFSIYESVMDATAAATLHAQATA